MDQQGDEISGNVEGDADTTAIGKNIKQEKNVGGQSTSNVYVYPAPPEKPRSKRRVRTSSGMAATVEEKIRDKLNEHDVKLSRLQDADATIKENLTDYVRILREDIVEVKKELRPLFGLGVQPQAQQADKAAATAQNNLVSRLLTIIAYSAGGGVILFFVVLLIGLIYLMFGGGF